MAFLKLRWDQGVHNAKELWQELRAQGYSGSHAQVMRWARLLKDGGGSETTKKRLTARQLVWVLLKEPEIESSDRSAFIGLLETAIPKIAAARQLVLEFLHGLREKNAGILEVWFATAKTNSELVDLQAFAVGLERDRSALEAAFTLAWSNGPTEGAVTRIKLIKRQGYGRAGFALLRRRVLLVA